MWVRPKLLLTRIDTSGLKGTSASPNSRARWPPHSTMTAALKRLRRGRPPPDVHGWRPCARQSDVLAADQAGEWKKGEIWRTNLMASVKKSKAFCIESKPDRRCSQVPLKSLSNGYRMEPKGSSVADTGPAKCRSRVRAARARSVPFLTYLGGRQHTANFKLWQVQ